jgi:hypothetical protein
VIVHEDKTRHGAPPIVNDRVCLLHSGFRVQRQRQSGSAAVSAHDKELRHALTRITLNPGHAGDRGGFLGYGTWRKYLKLAQGYTAAHHDGIVSYTAHELRYVCASLLIASGATDMQVAHYESQEPSADGRNDPAP